MENKIIIFGDYPNGSWFKREYDSNGKQIYYEDSLGNWEKFEYDSNSNLIYREDSDGQWCRYDSEGCISESGYKDQFPTPSQIKQYIENGK